MTKGRFSRVDVEVDTAFPLVLSTDVELEGVDLPIFWQRFEFEHIHLFCSSCGCVGHPTIECKYASQYPSASPVKFGKGLASSVLLNDCSASLSSDVPMGAVDSTMVTDDDPPAPLPWIHHRRGLQRQPLRGGFKARATTREFSRGRARDAPLASTSILGPSSRGPAAVTSGPTTSLSLLMSRSFENIQAPVGPDVGSNQFGPLCDAASLGLDLKQNGRINLYLLQLAYMMLNLNLNLKLSICPSLPFDPFLITYLC